MPFYYEKVMSGEITTSFVGSNELLTDIFTMSLQGPRITYLCCKLDAYNLYAPGWGGELRYYVDYRDIY